MFTIKHIDIYGNEFVMEATSYAVTRERQPGKPDFLRIITYDTPYRSADYSGLWAGVPGNGCLEAETIFVMNRNGATVDKIIFKTAPDNYWGTQEPTTAQADPEKLAA